MKSYAQKKETIKQVVPLIFYTNVVSASVKRAFYVRYLNQSLCDKTTFLLFITKFYESCLRFHFKSFVPYSRNSNSNAFMHIKSRKTMNLLFLDNLEYFSLLWLSCNLLNH